ncbi:transcriptional regulator [Salmonella enterica subsp. enterica]|nr:transcriptional regulator [Salmonella enterica subsp. enterica serovar Mokola]EIC6029761.1 transcriptional regulator [Salmonella enterica subsp. enterica serovar Corvallis]HDA4096905.1 transcriptional regulator [Salmonella enterica subsp. enterica serovar Mokola]HDA4107003.1 transcriptional regulator [Salmonella enterica subsp. enterica serovar Mokola]HDA4157158.1 transcriptional regulator [Salmonella enterica subsp. enterica serovar Mokola]
MTGHNRMPVRQVIVHGDCWPVTTAVAHLVRTFLPGSDCETTYRLPALLQQLRRKPEAILILCQRPREHLFLFYALRQVLPDHPVMVISDELLFSDRLVLQSWGDIPVVLQGDLTGMVTRLKLNKPWQSSTDKRGQETLITFLSDPKPVTGFFAVPPTFITQKRLMNYMALLMYRASVKQGVSPAQLKLLEEVYKGRGKISALSGKLQKGEKQLWQDKYRLLVKLGMNNRLRELLFGTRFCEAVQRTPFMAPGKTEQCHNSPDWYDS